MSKVWMRFIGLGYIGSKGGKWEVAWYEGVAGELYAEDLEWIPD